MNKESSAMSHWIEVLCLGLAALGLLSVSACVDGLPEKDSFGYALPVRPDTDVWTASRASRPSNEVVSQRGHIYRVVDLVPTADGVAGVGISATNTANLQTMWLVPLPVPALTSIHNQNEKSFVSDTSLMLAGDRLLATYRFFAPAQYEPDNMGTSAPTHFWEFALFDASSGRLIRHERMPHSSKQIAFTLLGGHWFATDNKTHETTRLDPATGDKFWVHGGLFFFSDLTEQTIGLYRHTLGHRWRATVLDLATGKERFDFVFEALPMQIIRRVGYHNGITYVELGVQYMFNVELGPRYKYYTIAFDSATNKPIWRTAITADKS